MCFRPAAVSMSVTCPKCGAECALDAKSCSACGADLPDAPSVPGAPGAPGAPSMPGMPAAPGAPAKPSAPGAPKAPGHRSKKLPKRRGLYSLPTFFGCLTSFPTTIEDEYERKGGAWIIKNSSIR